MKRNIVDGTTVVSHIDAFELTENHFENTGHLRMLLLPTKKSNSESTNYQQVALAQAMNREKE